MENYGGSLKNSILWEFSWFFHEKSIYRGIASKGGAWRVCKFKGVRWEGELAKKRGMVFLRGQLIPRCKLWFCFQLGKCVLENNHYGDYALVLKNCDSRSHKWKSFGDLGRYAKLNLCHDQKCYMMLCFEGWFSHQGERNSFSKTFANALHEWSL